MSVLDPVIDYLDTTNKHIYLVAGCREYHPIDDIYKEIRNLRRTNEVLRGHDIMVQAFGAIPKGGGKFTPRYAQFNNGWKVVPEDTTHDLYISGEQLTDDGQSGKACLDLTVLSAGTNVFVHYEPPAAELIKAEAELEAIKRMIFDKMVTINTVNGYEGTEWPIGAHSKPAKLLSDALIILANEGLSIIHSEKDATIDSGLDYTGLMFVGASKTKTTFTITAAAITDDCEFYDAHVTGTLDGDTLLKDCLIDNINYVTGYIEQCVLGPGTILLGAGAVAHFLNCYRGGALTGYPTIDMGGSGTALSMQNYAGEVRITNKTGGETVNIGLQSGEVRLTSTVTSGLIKISGRGRLVDDVTGEDIVTGTYGSLTVVNELMNDTNTVRSVFNGAVETGYSLQQVMQLIGATLAGKLNVAQDGTFTIRNLNDTLDRLSGTLDESGNRTSVNHNV